MLGSGLGEASFLLAVGGFYKVFFSKSFGTVEDFDANF